MAKKKSTPAKKKPVVARVAAAPAEKPPWNIYSMLLLLGLFAQIVACVMLWMELSSYGDDPTANKFKQYKTMGK